MTSSFRPALIVVDVQEDFCPPHGPIAVPDARAIVPVINTLLSLPFIVKVATRDWHPPSHVSFAVNHEREREREHNNETDPTTNTKTTTTNTKTTTTTTTVITHPTTGATYTTRLWPVHCVAHTPGAALLPSLHATLLHRIIDKGCPPDREMYSGFCDPFGESDTGLANLLFHPPSHHHHTTSTSTTPTSTSSDSSSDSSDPITHVFVVGLALDFCVLHTALHAAQHGFTTVVVADATRAAFPHSWDQVASHLRQNVVRLVMSTSQEVARVKALST